MVVMFKMLMFRLFVSTQFDAPFGVILHFQTAKLQQFDRNWASSFEVQENMAIFAHIL